MRSQLFKGLQLLTRTYRKFRERILVLVHVIATRLITNIITNII